MSVKSNSRSGSPAKMSRTFSPFLSRAYSEIACWIRRSDRPLTMMYPPRPLSASASISCRIGVPGSQEEMTKSERPLADLREQVGGSGHARYGRDAQPLQQPAHVAALQFVLAGDQRVLDIDEGCLGIAGMHMRPGR